MYEPRTKRYTDWTDPKQVDKFMTELLLWIHSEFCYQQRDEDKYWAGWDTISRIQV